MIDGSSESGALIGRIGAVIVNKYYHDGVAHGVLDAALTWGVPADFCEISNGSSVICALGLLAVFLSLFEMRYSPCESHRFIFRG